MLTNLPLCLVFVFEAIQKGITNILASDFGPFTRYILVPCFSKRSKLLFNFTHYSFAHHTRVVVGHGCCHKCPEVN